MRGAVETSAYQVSAVRRTWRPMAEFVDLTTTTLAPNQGAPHPRA